MVAIRKIGNGAQSTHKFIIEEQYIRFIDTFPPRLITTNDSSAEFIVWPEYN